MKKIFLTAAFVCLAGFSLSYARSITEGSVAAQAAAWLSGAGKSLEEINKAVEPLIPVLNKAQQTAQKERPSKEKLLAQALKDYDEALNQVGYNILNKRDIKRSFVFYIAKDIAADPEIEKEMSDTDDKTAFRLYLLEDTETNKKYTKIVKFVWQESDVSPIYSSYSGRPVFFYGRNIPQAWQ